jgi:signal peptidase II
MTFLFSAFFAFLLSLGVNIIIDTWHPSFSFFGYLSLTLLHNSGVAFGLKLPVFLQYGAIGLALLGVFFIAQKAQSIFEQLVYGLILGGACANLFDRVMDGVVTDYFQIGTFPVFNVADVCITVGVGLLLMHSKRSV